jgi:hypothetical protein
MSWCLVHSALKGFNPNEFQSDIRRCTLKRNFLLPLGGLHVKHAVQRGIWVPTQHLLWDRGKPRKTLIELAGLTGFEVLRSHYDWRSVSISWRRAHLGTCDQILTLSKFCCLVSVDRPLWREVRSVVASARAQQKTPLLCWCEWRSIVAAAALSDYRRTAWWHSFPHISYCRLTSQQKRTWRVQMSGVCAAVVTWPGNHENMFTELLPLIGCLLIQLFVYRQTCHIILGIHEQTSAEMQICHVGKSLN